MTLIVILAEKHNSCCEAKLRHSVNSQSQISQRPPVSDARALGRSQRDGLCLRIGEQPAFFHRLLRHLLRYMEKEELLEASLVQMVQTKVQLILYMLFLLLSSLLSLKEEFVWTIWTTPCFTV